jgi:hypothetical protein
MDPNETVQKLLNQGLLFFYLFIFCCVDWWLLCVRVSCEKYLDFASWKITGIC